MGGESAPGTRESRLSARAYSNKKKKEKERKSITLHPRGLSRTVPSKRAGRLTLALVVKSPRHFPFYVPPCRWRTRKVAHGWPSDRFPSRYTRKHMHVPPTSNVNADAVGRYLITFRTRKHHAIFHRNECSGLSFVRNASSSSAHLCLATLLIFITRHSRRVGTIRKVAFVDLLRAR